MSDGIAGTLLKELSKAYDHESLQSTMICDFKASGIWSLWKEFKSNPKFPFLKIIHDYAHP